jgi:soluble lytic murein transglycosylase-like protein
MTGPLRAAVAVLAALAPAALGGPPSPGDGTTASAPLLRATLRAAPALHRAPAWLERIVCEKGSGLGETCGAVAAAVAEEAQSARLDPLLVLAIIEVESGWDPDAVSGADAHGLMQLLLPTLEQEATFTSLESVDAHDPVINVRAGIRFYGRLVRQFADADLAMVAYNAGPYRVARYLEAEQGIPERLWGYPRAIRRAEARLRAHVNAPLRMVAALESGLVAE